jgi:hypothetical protein
MQGSFKIFKEKTRVHSLGMLRVHHQSYIIFKKRSDSMISWERNLGLTLARAKD